MIITNVVSEGLINAPVDTVWGIIRGFNSLAEWHPYVASSELIEGDGDSSVGAIRRFEQVDGSMVTEKLLALDDLNYSMTYLLLDAPIPVKDYVASIKLQPVAKMQKTMIVWRVDYKVLPEVAVELNKKLDEVFVMGFDELNKRF